MNKKKVLAMISRMPVWVNLLIMKLNRRPSLIFGDRYLEKYNDFFLNKSSNNFVNFVNFALNNIDYYRRRYPCVEIKSLNDFKKLVGTISKDDVLSHMELLTAKDTKGSDVCTTGGTSGKPLKLLLPKSRYADELGALHALWSRLGYNFSVRAVVRNERLDGRDYIVNPITKEFIFDGFRSDPGYLDTIYHVMRKYNISYYHGYTSNAERFVAHLLLRKYDYSFLKGLITSSENFYDHQRALFNKLVGVKHLNFYGHSEKLLIGGWCEEGGAYHFYSSYGYPELLDENNNDISEVNAIGELVGSTNYNIYMPLIRYRTGDFAVKAPENCHACGFHGLSVYKILGRWKGERIYNKDGSFVSTTALNLHNHIYEHIDGLQYCQVENGSLEVRVVPGEGYNSKIENELLNCIIKVLHSDAVVTIRRVKDVERLPNGKYLLLIGKSLNA